MKKFCLCMVSIALLIGSVAFAQDAESSVEDEYLSDVDSVVILGLAASNEYENKLYAYKMVEKAVNSGNVNPEIMKALCQLAGEGLNTQSRTNGQVINNFPDIRRDACLLMGKVKTEEAKSFLVQVVLAEKEPMVIAASVNSLGNIGLNKNDEVVNAIAFMNRRNQILNPTNSLASEVIDTYEKLLSSTENKKPVIDSLTQIASDYHYNKTIRAKALKLMKSVTSDSSSDSTSGNSSDATAADAGSEPQVE